MPTRRRPARKLKPYDPLSIILGPNNNVELRFQSHIYADKSVNKSMRVHRQNFVERYQEMANIIAEKLEYAVAPKYWIECRPTWKEIEKHLKIAEVSRLENPELFHRRDVHMEFKYMPLEEAEA